MNFKNLIVDFFKNDTNRWISFVYAISLAVALLMPPIATNGTLYLVACTTVAAGVVMFMARISHRMFIFFAVVASAGPGLLIRDLCTVVTGMGTDQWASKVLMAKGLNILWLLTVVVACMAIRWLQPLQRFGKVAIIGTLVIVPLGIGMSSARRDLSLAQAVLVLGMFLTTLGMVVWGFGPPVEQDGELLPPPSHQPRVRLAAAVLFGDVVIVALLEILRLLKFPQ